MHPEATNIDTTGKNEDKTPNETERRPIKFEAVRLEDYPGKSPDLGPRCRQIWADARLRDQYGIPEHVQVPDFAFEGRRLEVRHFTGATCQWARVFGT